MNADRRVVVTGVGMVTPIGSDVESTWESVKQGRCGIGSIELLDTRWIENAVAGEVKDPAVTTPPPGVDADDLPRSALLVLNAAREAVASSGLDDGHLHSHRTGLILGTCQGSLGEEGPRAHVVDAVHVSCDVVSEYLGIRGPRSMVSTACSAGANAIAFASEKILEGAADVMFAGGTDALTFYSLSGFKVMGSLADGPCSPYGRSDGLSLGEGAAVLVLEEWDHAWRRGARVYAELLGHGLSADAYHPSAPDPSGRGAVLAVRRALEHAGVTADQVDYVNGHGTATVANDSMERHAMRTVFGSMNRVVPCSSTKSMTGHTLGAAGAIEAAICVLATRDDVMPPTVNFDKEPEDGFDFVPNASRAVPVDVAVSNNYAFGGNNASLVIGKPHVKRRPRLKQPDRDVLVTGVGAVGSAGIGVDSWWDSLTAGQCTTRDAMVVTNGTRREVPCGGVPPLKAGGFAPGGYWRKMDMLGRQAVASSKLAWNDARLELEEAERENVAVLLGTNSGSVLHAQQFDAGAKQGPRDANPVLFPNSVLNSSAGHVCTMLGLRGPTATITSGGVSSLVAMMYAASLIRRGRVDVAVVVGADELCEATVTAASHIPGVLTDDVARPFDQHASGTAVSASGITVILESAEHAARRGADAYCRVLAGGMAASGPPQKPKDAWRHAFATSLAASAVDPAHLGYVVAAASGIRVADEPEAVAIQELVGTTVPVSAPKSVLGETLGAAGVAGVLVACLALNRGVLTPTINMLTPLESARLAHVRDEPIEQKDTGYCLVDSVAAGGNHASLVLAKV